MSTSIRPFHILSKYSPAWFFAGIKATHRFFATQRRKNAPFSEVEFLGNYKLFDNEFTSDRANNRYSLSEVLKNYAGISRYHVLQGNIEHGTYGTSWIASHEIENGKKGIITLGSHRVPTLTQVTNAPIYCIGPYIQYVDSLLSLSKIHAEQQRLGKNLLVFPIHSTDLVDSQYDVDALCSYIDSYVKEYKFDTVRISVHFADVQRGKHIPYLKRGYECVCSGHHFDPFFLPRLRSIIECSSMTLSNGIGTHSGYALALGKGHHILPQKRVVKASSAEAQANTNDTHNAYETASLFNEFTGIMHATPSGLLTPRAQEIANEIWGLNIHKTKEEMRDILLSLI